MKVFAKSSFIAALGLLFALSPLSAKINCEKPPSEILLIRHGCRLSCVNDATPLSAKGKEQAAELVKRLGHYDLQAIFITHKLRTEQTASPLANYKKLTPIKTGSRPGKARKSSEPESKLGTVKELVQEICSGSYSGTSVLYVGHSDTLGDVLRELAPSFPYKTPPCAEGWVIAFDVPNPAPKALPAGGIICEKPKGAEPGCCSGHASHAAG